MQVSSITKSPSWGSNIHTLRDYTSTPNTDDVTNTSLSTVREARIIVQNATTDVKGMNEKADKLLQSMEAREKETAEQFDKMQQALKAVKESLAKKKPWYARVYEGGKNFLFGSAEYSQVQENKSQD